MKTLIQNILLYIYKLFISSGILETKPGNILFLKSYFLYKNYIESENISVLKQFANNGDTIIDVGANIGWFTRHACTWIEPGGKVLAIEPEQKNLFKLNTIINTFNLTPLVDVIEAAVSDYNGKLFLEINPYHPGDHKISDKETDLIVKALTIDTIVQEKNINHVSLVKIDVQGSELRVLKGAIKTIEVMRPAFFIEIDETALNNMNTSTSEILSFMESFDYVPYLLVNKTIKKTDLAEILDNASNNKGYLDALFIGNSNNS